MRIIRFVLLISTSLVFTTGCNQTDQLPVGSALTAFPNEVAWQIADNASCDIENGPFNDTHISLSLVDSENRGVTSTPMDLSLDLSGNSFTGDELLSLYYDHNQDGIYSEEERSATSNGTTLRVNTDDAEGVVRAMVRVNLSCAYIGNLYALAGGLGTTIGFVVQGQTEVDSVVE